VDDKPIMPQRRYLSYLLRLWRENDGDLPMWRSSLEIPQDGERLVFVSLADLFVFLERETGLSSPGSNRSDEGGCQPPESSE